MKQVYNKTKTSNKTYSFSATCPEISGSVVKQWECSMSLEGGKYDIKSNRALQS